MGKPQSTTKIEIRPTTLPEDISSDLHDEEQGLQADGRQELPHTDDTHYDAHQGRGVARFTKEADATIQSVRDYCRSLVQETRSLYDKISNMNSETVYQESNENISIIKNEWRATISSAIVQRIQMEKDELSFMQTHQINREAVYPHNTFNVFALLALIVVAEAIFNSFNIGLHQRRGLLDGSAIAFMFAWVNISLAWLAGNFFLRWTNCEVRRLRGHFFFALTAMASLSLNAFLATYRESLTVTPTNFSEVYFIIHSIKFTFPNLLFLLTGFIAFLFSAYKVYKSEDPYPGFSDVARRKEDAKDHEDTVQDEAGEEVRKTIEAGFKKLDELPSKADHSVAQMYNLSDRGKSNIEAGNTHLVALQDNSTTWLLYVRGINSRVRNTPPPAYYQTLFPSFALGNAGHSELKQIDVFIKDATTYAKDLRDKVVIARGSRLSELEKGLGDFQEFINALEAEAQVLSTNTQNIDSRSTTSGFNNLQKEGV